MVGLETSSFKVLLPCYPIGQRVHRKYVKRDRDNTGYTCPTGKPYGRYSRNVKQATHSCPGGHLYPRCTAVVSTAHQRHRNGGAEDASTGKLSKPEFELLAMTSLMWRGMCTTDVSWKSHIVDEHVDRENGSERECRENEQTSSESPGVGPCLWAVSQDRRGWESIPR